MTMALVTGATGFIGKRLVSYLLDQNISVRVLVRHYQGNDVFPSDIEQHVGDLTNPATLADVACGVDIVFHLGGYAHAWEKNSDFIEQQKKVNLIGTQNLLNECTRSNVKKIIFFSSIKAVGDANHCVDENWNESPNTPYGLAKRAAEELVLMSGKTFRIHVCVLRLALVYGPFLKGNLYQMLRAIDKKYFLPISPTKNYRSLVSVYDVCQAAWLAAQCEKANGKIYFVADNESYSTFYIYSLMRTALGRSKPSWYLPLWVYRILAFMGDKMEYLINRRLPFNSHVFNKLFGMAHCSSINIQKELGFSSKYSLDKLLPEIIRAYRKEQV
ncbi:MAG TPA: NAD-dependent epimerase/dehydratase family protein [Gammaproteobacteria bacterium]|nr:NAD-dependent epimerase/dehydratase family protein [Gammaproteobacteria bacterium]